MRDHIEELRSLGLRATIFRAQWELSTRYVLPRLPHARKAPDLRLVEDRQWTRRLPFADPATVAEVMRDRVSKAAHERLIDVAEKATVGKILCFGRWTGDYGHPIDWTLNPQTGKRWPADIYWSIALADAARVGDVKLTWEVARFPHAYHLARAAAVEPRHAERFGAALLDQLEKFDAENSFGRGIHWSSGQEIAIRTMSWVFALDALFARHASGRRAAAIVARAIEAGARHIESVIDYARYAVNNNHLITESLGLYLAGTLLPNAPAAARRRELGRAILEREADRQFYADGAYLNLSHNYHRNVLQLLLWACVIARAAGDAPAPSWLRALERSLDFLVQHQNPIDGRLPNFGANDGSLPSVFSTCDHSDFRPTLQAVSLMTRGERLYEPGPWDEEAAWFGGAAALDAPLRPPVRRSVSFAETGFHVLRGADARTFVAFRCGSLRDRFAQIDMLHVDVWWRGLNVFVDGGTFLYNGPHEWHEHFMRTASHNTMTVDGRDQMLHHRKFKFLYPTKARLLEASASQVSGEHEGYRRHDPECVHRRSVRLAGDDMVIVVDRVSASTSRTARLQWLGGDFPFRSDVDHASMTLDTPEGPYAVAVFDEHASRLEGNVVAGADSPPRGWASRYYGEKVAVPSLEVIADLATTRMLITVMGRGAAALNRVGDVYSASCDGTVMPFTLRDGCIVTREARA